MAEPRGPRITQQCLQHAFTASHQTTLKILSLQKLSKEKITLFLVNLAAVLPVDALPERMNTVSVYVLAP